MRKNFWMALTLAMILPAMFFLVSCAKDAVQTHPTQIPQSELPKAEGKSADKSEQAGPRDEATNPETAGAEFVNDNIHFALDSAVLSDQAKQILTHKAEYLHKNPGLTITVEGHCDERGTDAYNIALGDRRAKSVKDFLVNMGIGADRLNTISYGEERPIALGRDEVSWAKNRRAQFGIQ